MVRSRGCRQLGTIGLDDEVDCQAVGGPRLGRPYDGHQGIDGVRSRSRRSVQVEGHAISVGTNPDA